MGLLRIAYDPYFPVLLDEILFTVFKEFTSYIE